MPITEAQKAFWQRVNEDGGIGGYDIDVTDVRPRQHLQPADPQAGLQEIKGDVLALPRPSGHPPLAVILRHEAATSMVGAPASWTSLWAFEDVILESGTNYCFEGMNAVDYVVARRSSAQRDGRRTTPVTTAATAPRAPRSRRRQNGLDFQTSRPRPGQEEQAGAIPAILSQARPGHPRHRRRPRRP